MKRVVFVLLMSWLSAMAVAQSDSITVSGKIRLGSNPSEGCIVTMLAPQDSSIVAYTLSDKDGFYVMPAETSLSHLLLKVSGFNIKKQIKKIIAKTQTVDFDVEEESVELQEVVVRSKKLWSSRDTLNYLVSAYMKDNDRTIGDVLKKLPGIAVDADGKITYQGVPIKTFYIENLNMLKNNYNVATEGIKAEDVASVQVMENHEEVRALQDQKPSGQAAINLKLKEKAKGVWTYSADIGGGADANGFLWEFKPQISFFGKGKQFLIRYDGRNTAGSYDNVSSEVNWYSHLNTPMTGIVQHSLSPVGSSTFGHQNRFSFNNIVKISEEKTLTTNLNYSNSFSFGDSYSKSTYFLPDNTALVITEDVADRKQTDNVIASVNFEKNNKKHYFSNTFKAYASWNSASGEITATNANEPALADTPTMQSVVTQKMNDRKVGLYNHSSLVSRSENGGGFEWRSTNKLSSFPRRLALGGSMDASQDMKQMLLSTSNSFKSLRDMTRQNWSLTLAGNLNATYTGLKTDLIYPTSPVAPKGDMGYLKTDVKLGPNLQYANDVLHIEMNVPAALTYTRLTNTPVQGEVTDANRLRVYAEPSVSLIWQCADRFTLESNGNYNTNETSWPKLLTASIMQDYRTISRYRASLADNFNAGAKTRLAYKDVFSSIFAHIQANWSRTWSDIAYGTTFDKQGLSVIEAAYTPNQSNRYSLSAYGRKDFDWHTIQLDLTLTGNMGDSEVLRQSVLTKYHNKGYNVRGTTAFDIVSGMRIEYNAYWTSSSSWASNSQTITFNQFQQSGKLSATLLPSKLSIYIDGSHVHNRNFASDKKDYVFIGAGLRYRMNKKLEFNLSADNLTNNRNYIVRSVDNMQEFYYESHLRPLSILLRTAITL